MQSPCKDCITLAICRSQVRSGDIFDLISLGDKCIHIRDLIFPNKQPLFKVTQESTIEDAMDTMSIKDKIVTKQEMKVDDPNKHLEQCMQALREDLLKDINFNIDFELHLVVKTPNREQQTR